MPVAKMNVLLVAHDADDRKFMREALGSSEYEIFTAPSGAAALSVMEERSIHIVLLDMLLPDLDGYSLCRQIRKIHIAEPLQIILVTTLVEEPCLTSALEIGGDDFIRRPFSDLELQVRLRAAAIRYRAQLSVVREREFFRQAARQEEELSSKIMDQNLSLRRAYENMEVMNHELERLNQELARMARFDILSGLMNRNSLFAAMDAEIDRAVRSDHPLCGVMIDIDHFKQINDSHGHQCGDEVIRMIGKCLKRGLRKYDQAGRYGGEEFFVLLPSATLEQAGNIAERFRQDLSASPVRYERENVPITASLGVARYRPGESKDVWIARADRAMYAAKQAGRNQVMLEAVS